MRGGLAKIIWTRSVLEIIDAQSRTRGQRQGIERGPQQEDTSLQNRWRHKVVAGDITWTAQCPVPGKDDKGQTVCSKRDRLTGH